MFFGLQFARRLGPSLTRGFANLIRKRRFDCVNPSVLHVIRRAGQHVTYDIRYRIRYQHSVSTKPMSNLAEERSPSECENDSEKLSKNIHISLGMVEDIADAAQSENCDGEIGTISAEKTAPPMAQPVKTVKEFEVSKGSHRKVKKRKGQRLHMTFKRARLTSDETLCQTKFYFENGLRKVVPYDYKYDTFCKGRWVGKTLGEIYTSEFRLYPIEYYAKAVKEGRVLVNLKPARSLEQILKENDLLTSLAHRHECPISDVKVQVIADTDEFFVINKPCTLPIHPVGRFRHNCLVSILAKEFDQKALSGIHRIDRMTSGLCVFAKSKERASKCHTQIRDRLVEKEYLCRVVGDFTKFELPPEHCHKITVEGKEVTVNEPLKIYDVKVGTTIVSRDDEAKDSETVFKCLSTDGKTSVVSCKPKTGRTHQIRVHLQYLGYPITNDPMYNHPVWGDERFTLGPITTPMDEVTRGLTDMKKWSAIVESVSKGLEKEQEVDQKVEMSPALTEAVSTMKNAVPYRSDCEECKHPLSDPKPDELTMYLHALRYKGPDWEFETPVPDWVENNDIT